MKGNKLKWLSGAILSSIAAGVMAAPYSVTYTGTTTTSSVLPAGVTAGQPFTVKIVLDNGNNSAANQAWSAANVQCMAFVFNSAQDKYTAVNYVGKPFTTSTTGTFTTDGSGQLQPGAILWEDLSDPITNPSVTNIAGTSLYDWFINARNDVIFWSGISVSAGLSNVAGDTQVTNWSNPVPAGSVCASYFTPAVVEQIPVLSKWSLAMLFGLLALSAGFALRRKQP